MPVPPVVQILQAVFAPEEIYGPSAACTPSSGTSHSQQSLQRKHFRQRWFAQVSLVHQTQISVEASPQMLQA
jgi:hypothetical protein